MKIMISDCDDTDEVPMSAAVIHRAAVLTEL